MIQKSYIIEGYRIPTGKKGGYYKSIIPEVFTAQLINHFLEKYPFLKDKVDEVILGISVGTGGNMARFTVLESELDVKTPATTIDFQCGSSLKAISIANNQINANQSDCILVGGMESNSLAPKRQFHANDFRYINEESFYQQATFAPQKYGESSLLNAAKNVALEYGISKEEMLTWTFESHKKAQNSINNDFLKSIIIPFQNHKTDQTIKFDLEREILQKSQSRDLIDHTNTAHLHDGASVLMMASEKFCIENYIQSKFEIIDVQSCGGEPTQAPKGIIWATEKLLSKNKFQISDIDLFEINESFALKPIVFIKHFAVDAQKVNIFGGNLAYGHPFGASGAMNLLHLMRALEVQNKEFGLVSMGVAGGLGISMLIRQL